MEVDQIKFMNLVMERTNIKLNELQSRVIVLEAQLQLAIEENSRLEQELTKSTKKEKKSEFTN